MSADFGISLLNTESKFEETGSFYWLFHDPTTTRMPIHTPTFNISETADERFYFEIWFQIINKETKDKSSSLKVILKKVSQSSVDHSLQFDFTVSVKDNFPKYNSRSNSFADFVSAYPFTLSSFTHLTCLDVNSPLINPDGSETLHCENLKKRNILIVDGWFTSYGHLPSPKQYHNEMGNLNVLRSFKESFESHYQSDEFSDVSVQVGEKTFKSHKFVLAAKSPVFRRMLLQEFQESKTGVIHISDFKPEIFMSFLKFLYTSKVEQKSISHTKDLYFLADKYDVQKLKRHCLAILAHSKVSEDQMYDLLLAAHQYNDEDLKKLAKQLLLTTIKK